MAVVLQVFSQRRELRLQTFHRETSFNQRRRQVVSCVVEQHTAPEELTGQRFFTGFQRLACPCLQLRAPILAALLFLLQPTYTSDGRTDGSCNAIHFGLHVAHHLPHHLLGILQLVEQFVDVRPHDARDPGQRCLDHVTRSYCRR